MENIQQEKVLENTPTDTEGLFPHIRNFKGPTNKVEPVKNERRKHCVLLENRVFMMVVKKRRSYFQFVFTFS